MPFQRAPLTIQAIVNWGINAQLCVSTFAYRVSEANYTPTNVQLLADTLAGLVVSELLPVFPVGAVFGLVTTRGLNAFNDAYGESADASGEVGSSGTSNLSGNVVKSIKRFSALSGKSARGRVYLPVPNTALATDENQVTSTWANAAVAALEAVTVALDALDFTEVIVSRFTGKAAREEAYTFDVLGYAVANLFVDSMRRRLTNRGS